MKLFTWLLSQTIVLRFICIFFGGLTVFCSHLTADENSEWLERVRRDREMARALLEHNPALGPDVFDEIVEIGSKLPELDGDYKDKETMKISKIPEQFKPSAGKWIESKISHFSTLEKNLQAGKKVEGNLSAEYVGFVQNLLKSQKSAIAADIFVSPRCASLWRDMAIGNSVEPATAKVNPDMDADVARQEDQLALDLQQMEQLVMFLQALGQLDGRYQRMLERARRNPTRGNIRYLEKAASSAGVEVPDDVRGLQRLNEVRNQIADCEWQIRILAQDIENKKREIRTTNVDARTRNNLNNEIGMLEHRLILEQQKAKTLQQALSN